MSLVFVTDVKKGERRGGTEGETVMWIGEEGGKGNFAKWMA